MSFFLGAKLSVLLCWCQIVLVPNCPVPNCPFLLYWCQFVRVPNCPVPNCPTTNFFSSENNAKFSAINLMFMQLSRKYCEILYHQVLSRPAGGGPRLDCRARIQFGWVHFGVFSTSRFMLLSIDFFVIVLYLSNYSFAKYYVLFNHNNFGRGSGARQE